MRLLEREEGAIREGTTHQRKRWWFYWILEEWEAASFLGYYYNIEVMLSYLVEE